MLLTLLMTLMYLAHPRNFFTWESGRHQNFEWFVKPYPWNKQFFTNMVSEILLMQMHSWNLIKFKTSKKDYQIANEQVRQLDDSRFKINTFTLNGALVRNNLNIELFRKNIETC